MSGRVTALDNILQAVGRTPLVRLTKLTRGIRTPVYAKAEHLNPGSSVKDRIGVAMIEAAEREGRLKAGGTIVEATSGNTGVGLAMAAAVRGYRCIFTIPDKMSVEKVRLLRALGAEVIVVPTAVANDHPEYYVNKARAIVEATPGAIMADQHFNPANPDAHYRTTGPEIWEQTGGTVTHFVCSPGTGGTVSGVGRYLKEKNPRVRVVAGDPVGSIYKEYAATHHKGDGMPYKVEGIGGDKIPTSLHFDYVDEWITVSDKDAFQTARRCTREEGLFVGGSSGLIAHVALAVARQLDDPGAVVVAMLPDTGERYLSKLYSDEWMRENQMLDADRTTMSFILNAKRKGHQPIISIGPGTTVRQALRLMSLHDVSQLPVMDGASAVGSVADWSLSAKSLDDTKLLDATVSQLMDPPFPTVDGGQSVDAVAKLMSKANPAVLVREDGKIAGIVTRSDMLNYLMGR